MLVAFDFSHQGHTLVTLCGQFLCSDWSKGAENLCSILKLVYFDSWSWRSFVSTCDVFNCLFPLNILQNEIQLLSRVFCYSWLVCLSGFCLRNTSLVKVGNPISDGIVFVFHLAWCVRGLKSPKRFWPYLIVFSASRMVSLSNYFIWCLFFIPNLMKSSVVYGAISGADLGVVRVVRSNPLNPWIMMMLYRNWQNSNPGECCWLIPFLRNHEFFIWMNLKCLSVSIIVIVKKIHPLNYCS